MSAYDLYDFTESIRLAELSEHAIEKVLSGWGFSPDGYGSWNGGFLMKLKDTRFAYVHGWCDTTGWGCQDGSEVHFFAKEPSKKELEELSNEFFYDIEDKIEWDEPINANRYLNGEINRWGDNIIDT